MFANPCLSRHSAGKSQLSLYMQRLHQPKSLNLLHLSSFFPISHHFLHLSLLFYI